MHLIGFAQVELSKRKTEQQKCAGRTRVGAVFVAAEDDGGKEAKAFSAVCRRAEDERIKTIRAASRQRRQSEAVASAAEHQPRGLQRTQQHTGFRV